MKGAHLRNTHKLISSEWTQSLDGQLAISHVSWHLMCSFANQTATALCWHAQRIFHRTSRLSVQPRSICLVHVCRCSIKNPSDKRFKWLPLWVMSSCISEEAFTAQQMKTDEKDCPLRMDPHSCFSGTNANSCTRWVHLRRATLFSCLSCRSVQSVVCMGHYHSQRIKIHFSNFSSVHFL